MISIPFFGFQDHSLFDNQELILVLALTPRLNFFFWNLTQSDTTQPKNYFYWRTFVSCGQPTQTLEYKSYANEVVISTRHHSKDSFA